jgi:hypothetical protein
MTCESAADGAARPREDARVPARQAGRDHLRGSLSRRFLYEPVHGECRAAGHFPGRRSRQHVSVARLGPIRRQAKGHQQVSPGHLGCSGQSSSKAGLVGDVGVGRQDEHDLVVGPVYGLSGQRHGRGRIAADRLADDVG